MLELTERQKELIRRSLALAELDGAEAVALFYEHLFQTSPRARSLFQNTDMQAQGQKFMQMLAVLAEGLDSPEKMLDTLRQLGQQHAQYGLQPGDYAVTGEALLWMFRRMLGDQFTPETKEAWGELYAFIAQALLAPDSLLSIRPEQEQT